MNEPRIKKLAKIQLIGLGIETSLAENKTFDLWHTFRKTLKELKQKDSSSFYSVQKYPNNFPSNFTPTLRFKKWAAIEEKSIIEPPQAFEIITLSGLYAVFIHKGTAATFPQTAQYIYNVWIPNSKYELDDNFHFELMKSDYNPNDPESKEEVWIPIKEK